MSKPFTFQRSPDTDAVVAVLRGCNHDVSYSDIANRSNQTIDRAMSVLQSARRILRHDGVLFGVIRGYGMRRLTDQDKVVKPEAFKRRVYRGARRELHDLDTIANFNGLSKTDQHSVTINRTLLHTLGQTANVKPKEPPVSLPSPVPDVSAFTGGKK